MRNKWFIKHNCSGMLLYDVLKLLQFDESLKQGGSYRPPFEWKWFLFDDFVDWFLKLYNRIFSQCVCLSKELIFLLHWNLNVDCNLYNNENFQPWIRGPSSMHIAHCSLLIIYLFTTTTALLFKMAKSSLPSRGFFWLKLSLTRISLNKSDYNLL